MLVHGELRQRAVGEGRGDNLWLHVAELQLGAIDEQQHSAAEGIQTSLITSTLLCWYITQCGVRRHCVLGMCGSAWVSCVGCHVLSLAQVVVSQLWQKPLLFHNLASATAATVTAATTTCCCCC